jgi:hypothetical protein
MTIQRGPPYFSINTDAAFTEDGVWLIAARLRFGRRTMRQIGTVVRAEARLSLLTALTREALRGRALGATNIRVSLDAGGRVTEFGFDDRLLDRDLLE